MVGRSHSCIPAQTKCRCAHYSLLNKGFRGVCHSLYSATNQRQHHVSGLLDAPTNVLKPCPDLEREFCNYISLVPKSSVQQWQRPRWRAISHYHILPRHMELAHAIRALSYHLLVNADNSFHSLRHYYIL